MLEVLCGEAFSFTFLPLVLVGLYEILYGENQKWWLICFGIFGVINSHILCAVFVLGLIIIICLINGKRLLKERKRLKNLSLAGMISILLSLSFILPYFEQIKSNTFNFEIYDNSKFLYDGALSMQDLLKDNISGVGSGFAVNLTLIILPALLLLCKNVSREKDRFLIHCYIVGLFFLLISTKLVSWEKLTRFSIIQFPFRFSMIYSLLFAYVAGEAVFRYFKDTETIKLLLIMLIFLMGNQLANVNINEHDSSYEAMINNYPLGLEEYAPIGLDTSANFICNIEDEPHVEKNEYQQFERFVDNEGNTIEMEEIPTIDYKQNGAKIQFYYENTGKKMNLHIPLTYYKGYVAYLVDELGSKHNLKLEKEEKNANIVISSDESLSGKVIVEYKMTLIQQVSFCISGITLSILIMMLVIQKKKSKNTLLLESGEKLFYKNPVC